MNKDGVFTTGDKEGVRGLIQYDEDNKYKIIEDLLENKVNPENKENIIEFIKFIIPIYKTIDCKFINILIRKNYFDIFKKIKDDVKKCIKNNLDSFIKLSVQLDKDDFVKYLVSEYKDKIKLVNLLIKDNTITNDNIEKYSSIIIEEEKEEKWVELDTLKYLFNENKYSLITKIKNNVDPKLLNKKDLPINNNDDGDVYKFIESINNQEALKDYHKK